MIFLFRICLNNFFNRFPVCTFRPEMQKPKHKSEWIRLRQATIVAFFFMMLGTTLELYLLDHYEGLQQSIPILCIGSSLLAVLILIFRKTRLMIALFKFILAITALSGFYGTFLHLRANYEFEQEMRPTLNGWNLFIESLSGALPALAPGSMIVLALIGYSYLILLKQKQ